MSINGIVAGPTLGLFTLGMLCPWVSSRSAGVGFLSGLGTGIMLYSMSTPTDQFTKLLDVDTSRCENGTTIAESLYTNQNTTMLIDEAEDSIPFQISYIYLSTGKLGIVYIFLILHLSAGLFVTLTLSSLASLVFAAPLPAQRKKGLFSTLIWESKWAMRHFTDDESLQSDEKMLMKY